MHHILDWDISLFKLINHRWKCFFPGYDHAPPDAFGGTKFTVLGLLALLFFFRDNQLSRGAAWAMIVSQSLPTA